MDQSKTSGNGKTMPKIEDYLGGEDLAQLLKDLEYVLYHGFGAVEIVWYNHHVESINRTTCSRGRRKREHSSSRQDDPNYNHKEK